MTRVGVVVPFYQRQPGLLRKALDSVLAQNLADDVSLVIVLVDDESPYPPDADLATLELTSQHELVRLARSNGGPGAARNTALDYLTKHPVDFVAFIDSDDVWLAHHLATALEALDGDGDFFFADHYRDSFNTGITYFEGDVTIQQWLKEIDKGPFNRTAMDHIYEVRNQCRLTVFLKEYLAQTATVVYRFDLLSHVRFDSRLRISGEDYLFWLCLAREARVIRFSTKTAVLCQDGLNIYYSTLAWDHPNAPARFAYQLMLWRHVHRNFSLTAEQRAITAVKAAGFSRGFSYIWTRALAKTGRQNRALLKMLKVESGWSSYRIIWDLIGTVYLKVRRMPLFPEH